jgi:hypothetical protein
MLLLETMYWSTIESNASELTVAMNQPESGVTRSRPTGNKVSAKENGPNI